MFTNKLFPISPTVLFLYVQLSECLFTFRWLIYKKYYVTLKIASMISAVITILVLTFSRVNFIVCFSRQSLTM